MTTVIHVDVSLGIWTLVDPAGPVCTNFPK